MPDRSNIAAMQALATTRRDGAKRARLLARGVSDQQAQDGLARYADELEKQADELESQIAALNAVEVPPDEEKVVAFKRLTD